MEQESTTTHENDTSTRLEAIKSVYAARQLRTKQKQLGQSEKEFDTTPTLPIGKKTSPENDNGAEKIELNIESSGGSGTNELKNPNVGNNSPAAFETDPSTDLREHLRNLRAASSESMNLLDSTTEHLHGLMKKVEQSFPNSEIRTHQVMDQVKITCEVAKQLHSSMKLKLETVKTLHKISKDIAETK